MLDGLETLPPEVVRAVGDHGLGDSLSIRLPPHPAPASVAAVVRRVGAVMVRGLDRLAPDVAAALTDHDHMIEFADPREVLYGPFGFVDTHGNQNALRLGGAGRPDRHLDISYTGHVQWSA